MKMRKRMRNGPVRNYLRKRSGSLRREVGWTEPSLPGGTNLLLRDNTWPTPGKGNFRWRTWLKMDSNGPHRWVRFQQMAMAFTTWPAMSGSGPRIGTRITTRSLIHVAGALIRAAA